MYSKESRISDFPFEMQYNFICYRIFLSQSPSGSILCVQLKRKIALQTKVKLEKIGAKSAGFIGGWG